MHELYTIAEVFQEAMVSFLKIYGSDAFLEDANFSYHGKERIKDKTPSWVPDWRKANQRNWWHKTRLRQSDKFPLPAHVSGSFLHTVGVMVAEVGEYYGGLLGNDSSLDFPVKQFFDTFRAIVDAAMYPKEYLDRWRRLSCLLTEGRYPSPQALDQQDPYDHFSLMSLFSDHTSGLG